MVTVLTDLLTDINYEALYDVWSFKVCTWMISLDLKISEKLNQTLGTKLFPNVFKRAAVFLNCTRPIFWALASKPACRILVWMKHREWPVKFLTTFSLKFLSISYGSLTKRPHNLWERAFPMNFSRLADLRRLYAKRAGVSPSCILICTNSSRNSEIMCHAYAFHNGSDRWSSIHRVRFGKIRVTY